MCVFLRVKVLYPRRSNEVKEKGCVALNEVVGKVREGSCRSGKVVKNEVQLPGVAGRRVIKRCLHAV